MKLHPRLASLAAVLVSAAGIAVAQPPAGYYSTITTQTGEALKLELRAIVSGQRGFPVSSLSYDVGTRNALFSSVDNINGTEPPDQIRLFYTGEIIANPGGFDGGTYSREHVWPQSYGANDGTNGSRRTDLHHLFIAPQSINSTRGNKLFANIIGGTPTINPTGLPENQNFYNSEFFQVSTSQRGDVARAVFFINTRYDDMILVNEDFSTTEKRFGRLDDLLAWHDDDPVDQWERDRNDRVFAFQNNRNPYIDNPLWVDLVYRFVPTSDGDTITVAASSVAPLLGARGTTITALRVDLQALSGEFDAATIGLRREGDYTDALTLQVFVDLNANDLIDGGDLAVGTVVSPGVHDSLTVNLPARFRITNDATTRLLVGYALPANATSGRTIRIGLAGDSIVHAVTGGVDIDPGFATFRGTRTIIMPERVSGDVFFSEYLEGTGNNKAVEIYNARLTTVDLTGWRIESFNNGSTTVTSGFNLSGTLAPGAVYTFATTTTPLPVAANQTTGSTSLWNGDDAVVLRDADGAIRDVIGRIGEQAVWGTAPTRTQDATLRRKPAILVGDTNPADPFDPAVEWNGFPVDTFGDFGQHTVIIPDTAPLLVAGEPVEVAEDTPTAITMDFVDPDDPGVAAYAVSIANLSSGNAGTPTVARLAAGLYRIEWVYTPPANFNGAVSHNVQLNDVPASAQATAAGLAITVTAVNDAPTLAPIANQSAAPGATLGPIGLAVDDVDDPAASLVVTAESLSPAVVPNAALTIGGSGANRTLTIAVPAGAPPANVVIRVTVADAAGATAVREFTLAIESPTRVAPDLWLTF